MMGEIHGPSDPMRKNKDNKQGQKEENNEKEDDVQMIGEIHSPSDHIRKNKGNKQREWSCWVLSVGPGKTQET